MKFSAYEGAGLADGLNNATNTLLQIQMYKQKMAHEDKINELKQKHEDAQEDYWTKSLQVKVDQGDVNAAIKLDALKEKAKANDALNKLRDTQNQLAKVNLKEQEDLHKLYLLQNTPQQQNQWQLQKMPQGGQPSNVSPVAGFSSALNGRGTLPQEQAKQQPQVIAGPKGYYQAAPSSKSTQGGKGGVLAQGGKGGVLAQLGVDTEGKTPEQLRTEIQQKNPVLATYLDKVGHNRLPVRGSFGMSYNQVTELVSGLYPDYDPTRFPAVEALRKDFTSGKSSINLVALNTSLHHLDRLNDNMQKLNNPQWRLQGNIQNFLKNQGNDPTIRRVRNDLSAVSGELANTFKQSGATNEEIKNFRNNLEMSDSPETAKQSIDEFVQLIAGRTQPKFEQWKETTGGDFGNFPVIGDSGLKILNKFGYDYNSGTGGIEKSGHDGGQGDMQQMIDKAKSAGYSDEEIQQYLKSKGMK